MSRRLTQTEAREMGLIQEINRLLLHSRGIALQIPVDPDQPNRDATCQFIIDDDPDGWCFNWETPERVKSAVAKADAFEALKKNPAARVAALGYITQPLPTVDGEA